MESPNNKARAATAPEEITETVPCFTRSSPPSPTKNRTPVVAASQLGSSAGGGEEDDEDEDIYKIEKAPNLMESRRKKLKIWVLIEWIALVCIMGMLISSLTIHKLKHFMILELYVWKWCVLLLVIFCGRMFTEWLYSGLVFLIESNFLLKKKALYFVHGLKKSVQVCIWLGLVLVSWVALFRHNNSRIKRSGDNMNKIFKYVSRALVSLLVGAVIWLIKTVLVKILAASVNVNSFYDRIQESIFHQYVIQALSGPQIADSNWSPQYLRVKKGRTYELAENISTLGKLRVKKAGGGQEVIDVSKLLKLKQDKVSSWTKKLLTNVISTTKLSTTYSWDEEGNEQNDVEIISEKEARAAAKHIFRNVAVCDSSELWSRHIYKEDLLRYLNEEEVDNILPQLEGAVEFGWIDKSMLENWLVQIYLQRKSLASSLVDSETAVNQLNKVVSILVLALFVIVWLITMGLATTEVLLFIASQIFIFGNTTKAIFEGIIFVFLTHPFDVGDHCVIDGVQMIVEEINIMRTGFMRYDNQKIYYPNAVLANKTIANMHTSPFAGDVVEFSIDVRTPNENIYVLKDAIKKYIDKNPLHWMPNHGLVVLEIENMNKMKMALYVTHTMKHPNLEEKINRRSDLIFELKRICENLCIRYNLLPQELHVIYVQNLTQR